MILSIIVPVYNEEKTIKKVLSQLLQLKLPCLKEIIVVDDGSTDATALKIEKFKSKIKNIRYIRHQKNQGKGAAVRTGIHTATGDYILIQDADLEYDPSEIPQLLAPIVNHTSKRPRGYVNVAVYGSRFQNNQAMIPPLYFLGNKFLTFLTNVLYRTKLTDMETGYKLLPRSFLQKITLQSNHFDMEPEITAKLIRNGIRIIEVPISYKGRSHLAGKKLTLKDGFGAIKTLITLRFS